MQAINANTGITQWHTALLQDGPAGASLAVAGDTLYIGAGSGGTLFSVNAGTGAAIWAHQVAEDLASVPVIANGVIYVTRTADCCRPSPWPTRRNSGQPRRVLKAPVQR